MTLSASSVLHYSDSRFGSIPRVGGKPTHTRSSAGRWFDQNGTLQSAIVNTPRDLMWGTIAGEHRQVLRLEGAGTNLNPWPVLDGHWSAIRVVQTNNAVIAPDGSLTGGLIVEDGSNSTHFTFQNSAPATLVAGQTYTTSAFVKAKERTWIAMQGDGAGGHLGALQFFDLGTGTVGALGVGVTSAGMELVGNGWWRIWAAATATGTSAAPVVVLSTGAGVSSYLGDSVSGAYVWAGLQVENSPVPTSYIPTAGASASRAADSYSQDFSPLPQALMAYLRFKSRGIVENVNLAAVAMVVGTPGGNRVQIYSGGSGSVRFFLANGGASAAANTGAPVYGDEVEAVAVLPANGNMHGIMSVNAAAVTSSAAIGAIGLPAAWGDTKVWLNGALGFNVGANDYAELKIVKYADVVGVTDQAIMEELRAFEMNAAGEVINPGS